MLETLVSVVVMGIAIAGISELLFANTSWLTNLNNKFDTYYASRRFLSNFESDLHQAVSISNTESNNEKIVFRKAEESNFDSHGFLTYASSYQYRIVADTQPGNEGQFLVKAGRDDASDIVVLSGIVGPILSATGKPRFIQYVDRDTNTLSNTPLTNTTEVIVDLELERNDFGKTKQGSSSKSGLAIRSEIFLRNANIHAQ